MMILFDDFVEHFYQLKIDHRLLDSKMNCMKNFIGKIDLFQHLIVDFVDGFFMHGVSVKGAELVGLFICILCSQHCNVEKEFLSLKCSIINHLYVKYKILMFIIVEFYFCALELKVQNGVKF